MTSFKFLGPNHISGTNEATVVKFCKYVGRITTYIPQWAWSWSRDLLIFWELSDIISQMVQDRDRVSMEDYMKSYNNIWPIRWHEYH